MMRYLYIPIIITLIFFSCEDKDAIRVPELQEGANVRIIIDPDNSLFLYNDLANAKIIYDVYSQNQNIQTVELSVFRQPAGIGADTLNSDTVVVREYTQSDFMDGKILNESITVVDVANAVGVPLDSLDGGDQFIFSNRTELSNGLVFPSRTIGSNDNIEPGIVQNPDNASFTAGFAALVACPIDAPFTGTYELKQISGPSDVFNGDPDVFSPGEVTISQDGAIGRKFTTTYVSGSVYNFEVTFNFTLLCGNILVPHTGSGVGCGGGGLNWIGSGNSTYDLTDDSELTIEVIDNVDGDCGVGTEPLVFTLTKVE